MEGDAYSETLFLEKVLTTQHAGTTEARKVLSESITACCNDIVHYIQKTGRILHTSREVTLQPDCLQPSVPAGSFNASFLIQPSSCAILTANVISSITFPTFTHFQSDLQLYVLFSSACNSIHHHWQNVVMFMFFRHPISSCNALADMAMLDS